MKISLFKAALLLSVFGFTVCSCNDDLGQELTGSIIGTVADATTGEPVPTVSVSLEPGGKSAVTGSDGNYLFSELEAGNYTVSISKKGYNPDSRVISVESDKSANGDFLIERIPSVVTVDRDTLDFGDGSDVNSLSFNIVNSSYEDLEWKIEYDCDWIKEIRDSSGVLAYGRTQSIVVFIDRELLSEGKNETVVVVRSSNGSSDLVVTAIGRKREEVVLNTMDVEDITPETATFFGKIINAGTPSYTARGFVYSTSPNPTEATSIEILTAPVTDDEVYSSRVTGLTLNTKYYVRAFARSELGTFYSTNQVSFVAEVIDPKVTIQPVSNLNVSERSAVFNGTVSNAGTPSYTEKGFVYGTSESPTVFENKVTVAGNGTGIYNAKVSDLLLDRKYYVRAYAINGDGSDVIYSTFSMNFTLSMVAPEIEVLEVSDVDLDGRRAVLNGNIISTGDPEYTEKGFVYGTFSSPVLCDNKVQVDGTGVGKYSILVDNLQTDVDLYIWAYAVNEKGTVYSDEYVSLKLLTKYLPSVSTERATNVNSKEGSATLNGIIIDEGMPPYTERGFVYSTVSSEPTVNDTKIVVDGTGEGAFSIHLDGELPKDVDLYIRAFATNGSGTGYGEEVVISPDFIEMPELGIAVQTKNIGYNHWSSINSMCENSITGGYTDWRLPDIEELVAIYTEREHIGNYIQSYYWSSTSIITGRGKSYYYVDFRDGDVDYGYGDSRIYYGRCVRTLEP